MFEVKFPVGQSLIVVFVTSKILIIVKRASVMKQQGKHVI